MSERVLKVALVGCGQIADAHLQELKKVPLADVVAVCDQYVDLAEQAAARFEVPGVFADYEQMLREVRPDVVHITTPPRTHRPLAIQAMAAGAHVYVEKPFTLDAEEADEVLDAARAHQRQVCVGHDHLYDPVWEDCRRMYEEGRLGEIVHVDSVQGYDLGGPFGKAFASEPDHWVHLLPGGLFQNVMSHALYRITDFMHDEDPQLWATWFGAAGNAADTPTELRVMLRGRRTTANLLFSSTCRPVQRVARVYGTRGSIEVDFDGRTIRGYRSPRWPGAFAKIEAPYRHMTEGARALRRSLWKFLRSDIHYFAGMNRLFNLFYRSVAEGTAPPIPPAEIRRVTALMDKVFDCCKTECRARGGLTADIGVDDGNLRVVN